jgi:hypothetical protein
MSLMFLAAMMMAQAPAGAAPQPATAAQPAAKKQKPKQVCEYIELTGSRSKRRVCRDDDGNLDMGPGIKSGAYDKTSNQQSGGIPGGSN